ncbi:hypothetical protein [Alkalibacterium sp. MB6]|uniref:hypothetical protein n=1 Tax=Alkalibacterium sp. MB6 TaxID=2081965 RepID=UPI00137AF18E|nr:hypothetical protein [Alkalibacterium sp. MB6]
MYSFWIRAEQFYTLIMPVLAVFLLILLIAYIMLISYTEKGKPNRRWAHRVFFGILGLSALVGLVGHYQNQYWLEQNEFVTPGIREFNYVLGYRNNEDASIVRSYRRSSNLAEQLSFLDMYEGERTTRPFDYPYLGSEGNVHYFTYGEDNQYVFTYQGDIHWTEDERELVGWRYHLTDGRFEELGFHNEFDIIFDSLSLPKEEQKELEEYDAYTAVTIEEMIGGWNFGRQFY